MALTSPLKSRFEKIPLVLCGPIVRRVETDIVCVWIALKAKRKVRLEIYKGYCSVGDDVQSKKVATSVIDTEAMELGTNLHVALVTIPLVGTPLQPSEVYSYNLSFLENNI